MIPATATLTELLSALDRREVSSRELLDFYLDRIDTLDGPTNAVVTISAESARAQARSIDDMRASGATVGPLAGVPVTIKDAIATAGIRSTGGASELADHIPTVDATAVARLRRAGAVVFAKTNVPRWSGDYQSFNDLFGTTTNPWDHDRTPGGSSGGAAVAVAMGFTAFELGTDIGGSIRAPAAFCGIYGHKPSFAVVPTHGYLDHATEHANVADINVFGPLARSAVDLELVLDVIAGAADDDAAAWRLQLPQPRVNTLDQLRVGAWLDDQFCRVDAAVLEVLEAAIDALEQAGASVDRTARPNLDAGEEVERAMALITAATELSQAPSDAPGANLSHREWDLLHRARGRSRKAWARLFEDVDVLLCPVSPVPAFRHVRAPRGSNWDHSTLADHGDRAYRDLASWNVLTGSVYLPATVAPVGFTEAGLPVGVQIVAPYLGDRTSISVARLMAEVVGGYRHPPLETPDSSP